MKELKREKKCGIKKEERKKQKKKELKMKCIERKN